MSRYKVIERMPKKILNKGALLQIYKSIYNIVNNLCTLVDTAPPTRPPPGGTTARPPAGPPGKSCSSRL